MNHGAGRRLSRGEALRQLDQRKVDEQYRRDDILVNLDGKVPLDESSHCYKSAEEVVSAVVAAGLARVEHTLWPLASIKGNEEGAARDRRRKNKQKDRSRDRDRDAARKTKATTDDRASARRPSQLISAGSRAPGHGHAGRRGNDAAPSCASLPIP